MFERLAALNMIFKKFFLLLALARAVPFQKIGSNSRSLLTKRLLLSVLPTLHILDKKIKHKWEIFSCQKQKFAITELQIVNVFRYLAPKRLSWQHCSQLKVLSNFIVGYLLQNCSKMKFWKCEHKLSQSIHRLLKTFQKIWTVQDLSS